MARKPTPQQLYQALLDRYGEEIARAFMDAIADLRAGVNLQQVIAAVERGDIDAAIRALNLDPAAFAPVNEAIRAGYVEAGTLTAQSIRAAVVIRFDVRNPRAERWLAGQSSTLITRTTDDMRQAARQALVAGMERGDNPRTTALDLVGRIDKSTGQRAGGILGLTAQQETFVANARAQLASDDPADLRAYLERARRDKRFDRSIEKAIREGKPLPADIQAKALAQYKNGLLKLRGDMIGRTESLTALRAAKHESYLQAVASGQVQESAIRRTWRSAHDLRVRHTHRALDGDTVGLREAFTSPSGARLMYPGDPSAPAAEILNCRCDVSYRIDFLSNLGPAA